MRHGGMSSSAMPVVPQDDDQHESDGHAGQPDPVSGLEFAHHFPPKYPIASTRPMATMTTAATICATRSLRITLLSAGLAAEAEAERAQTVSPGEQAMP